MQLIFLCAITSLLWFHISIHFDTRIMHLNDVESESKKKLCFINKFNMLSNQFVQNQQEIFNIMNKYATFFRDNKILIQIKLFVY